MMTSAGALKRTLANVSNTAACHFRPIGRRLKVRPRTLPQFSNPHRNHCPLAFVEMLPLQIQ
jgi:hypothetical protein